MCIIAIYNNKNQINKERLEYMTARNGDGIGIAAAYTNGVYFIKGLKSANSAEAVIRRAFELGAHTVVFHARIATSGGVSAEKCHPYPLTADRTRLNTIKGTSGAVVFHNGILPIAHSVDENDTQAYIRKVLAPRSAEVLSGTFDEVIELTITGSRLVILTPDGAKRYGSGREQEDGVWYSNSGFKPYTPSKYYRWNAWDDYDERTSDEFYGYSAYYTRGGIPRRKEAATYGKKDN